MLWRDVTPTTLRPVLGGMEQAGHATRHPNRGFQQHEPRTSAVQSSRSGCLVDVDSPAADSMCICVVAEPCHCPWLSQVPGYNALAPPCVQQFLHLAGRRILTNPGQGDCWFYASEAFTSMPAPACRRLVAYDARVRQCVGEVVANEIFVMGTPTSTEHICIAVRALRQEYPHGLLILNAPMCAGVHFTAEHGFTVMRLPQALDLLRLHAHLPTMLFLRDGPPSTIGHFVACPLTSSSPQLLAQTLPFHVKYCCNFSYAWYMLGGVKASTPVSSRPTRRRLTAKGADPNVAGTQTLDMTTIEVASTASRIPASHLNVRTPEEARGVFMNPRGTTCYLGSVLQALLNTRRFTSFCLEHKPGAACGTPCLRCLLLAAARNTSQSSQQHSLEAWGMYLTAKGLDFTQQNDALEVLQILGDDADVGPQLLRMLALSGTRLYHVPWNSSWMTLFFSGGALFGIFLCPPSSPAGPGWCHMVEAGCSFC